jgi:hypothetical protein
MPQEVYRAAIVEINTYCIGRYGKASKQSRRSRMRCWAILSGRLPLSQ